MTVSNYHFCNIVNHDNVLGSSDFNKKVESNKKKSARFARTFSSRASRAARFARKNERALGARPNGRRASRSDMCDRRASRSDVYELRATRSVLRAS